ncbi:MAG: class II aldolase/adducin family protein [Firmicutes bacterium]|jgi:L-ribulose-5-phosphate 4-epimerase|nr:class II aldolase/adducin family protein [Candidatus Fermentithermobacillaceae bacterium]HHT84694.1 class II aldolase/adducin family protein [Candidatus Fermentithermobacillaceae bacterium]
MILEGLRKRVLHAALELRRSQMARGTSGNASARDPESGMIAITPSAIPYEELQVEDIVVISPAGEVICGHLQPSSETPMHISVYRKRPDVRGIVHTHSLYATVFSVLNKELPVITVPMAAFGPVRVVPFRLPGSQELADEVVRVLGTTERAVLLQNHGVLCAGNTVEEALECAVYTEEGAQVGYLALLAQGLNPIPDEYVAAMKDIARRGKAL